MGSKKIIEMTLLLVSLAVIVHCCCSFFIIQFIFKYNGIDNPIGLSVADYTLAGLGMLYQLYWPCFAVFIIYPICVVSGITKYIKYGIIVSENWLKAKTKTNCRFRIILWSILLILAVLILIVLYTPILCEKYLWLISILLVVSLCFYNRHFIFGILVIFFAIGLIFFVVRILQSSEAKYIDYKITKIELMDRVIDINKNDAVIIFYGTENIFIREKSGDIEMIPTKSVERVIFNRK